MQVKFPENYTPTNLDLSYGRAFSESGFGQPIGATPYYEAPLLGGDYYLFMELSLAFYAQIDPFEDFI